MKIALIRCPCIKPDYPPDIGLGYLCSFLTNFGHEVFVFDLNVEIFHKVDIKNQKRWIDRNLATWELNRLGEEISVTHLEYCVKSILERKPRIIGFSVWGSNISFTLSLAKKIKETDRSIIIVFGGPECYPLLAGKDLIKLDYVDIVVYGEGELTLKEIVDSVEAGKLLEYYPGAIVKNNGSYLKCSDRKPLYNLDVIPFPDYRQFPNNLSLNRDTLFISSGRGCIRKCVYCDVPGTMSLFRSRSADSLFEEMKCQINRHIGIKKFEFASPALNSNLKEISKLCDLIVKNKIEVYWSGNAILRPEMDLDILKKMKDAGCYALIFGLESGSQKILDKMGKMIKVKDAERILRDCYNFGILVTVNFIIGFPGEDDKDFEETLEFIKRNKRNINHIGTYSACWVRPYSAMFNNPERFGILLPSIKETNVTIRDWYDKESKENTYEARERREKELTQFIKSLELGMDYDNITGYEFAS